MFWRQHFLTVLAVLTLLFAFPYNAAFWLHLHDLLQGNGRLPLFFELSLPVVFVALMLLIFTLLFSWRYVIKPVFCLLFLTCSIASYNAAVYGVVFDLDMMVNFAQTNPAEALSYMSLPQILTFLLAGILPCLILYKIKIVYPSWGKALLQRIAVLMLCLITAGGLVGTQYQTFAFFFRQNSKIRHEILPFSYIWYGTLYLKETYFPTEYDFVTTSEGAVKISTTSLPKLLLFVVGETARASEYEVNGNTRNLNRYTKEQGFISFKDVTACGTYTAHSVPCMFSDLPRTKFKRDEAPYRENVLDILQATGTDITWVDNNSDCKGVCKRIPSYKIIPDNKKFCNGDTCYDGILPGFVHKVMRDKTEKPEDTVLVLHLIGSHGPRYYERYPAMFNQFLPDCNRADVENCSFEELLNTYDNTILYTDYVLTQLANVLKKYDHIYDTALLYVSDHGESLGEKGLYLHAAPYAFAPDEQTHVPMQLYLPDDTAQDMRLDKKCLRHFALTGDFSHDNIFHSLLGFMQVKSPYYRPELDIFSSCHDKSPAAAPAATATPAPAP